VPYGGTWNYTDPHSGQQFSHYQYDGLLDKIRAHRQANNFPIGLEFEQEIEAQLCLGHSAECDDLPEGLPYRTNLTLADVIRGSAVMMRFYAAGKPMVSREEAERRAQICVKCPLNDNYSKPCSVGICSELKAVVSAVIGQTGTRFDVDLKSCRICKCLNQASCWLPLDIQCPSITEDMKKQFQYAREKFGCWKECE
jgi:hypothetical protein